MPASFKIAYLADYPEFVETIGKWYWQEWDRHEGWNVEQSIDYAKNGCHKNNLDLTLIAIKEGKCIGTIQAMEKSFLPEYTHLAPWMGSFYIDKPFRNGRAAYALFEQLKKEIARLGIKTCYAHTSNLQRLFLKNGGKEIGHANYAAKEITIFEFNANDTKN